MYTYRGVPHSAGKWYVAGIDTLLGGGGVLEWCVSEEDARELMQRMRCFRQFSGLRVGMVRE